MSIRSNVYNLVAAGAFVAAAGVGLHGADEGLEVMHEVEITKTDLDSAHSHYDQAFDLDTLATETDDPAVAKRSLRESFTHQEAGRDLLSLVADAKEDTRAKTDALVFYSLPAFLGLLVVGGASRRAAKRTR